jgi:hypothetical protein
MISTKMIDFVSYPGFVLVMALACISLYFYRLSKRKKHKSTIQKKQPLNIPIVGISGLDDHGQDTLGELIMEAFENFHKESFAKPVKEACKALFMLTEEQTNGPNDIRSSADPYWSKLAPGTSPRKLMRWVGTEFGRTHLETIIPGIGSNLWVLLLQRRLEQGKQYVICDVRFENECKLIRDNGGVIVRVIRPGHEKGNFSHVSNNPDALPIPDFVVENSGSKKDLLSSFIQGYVKNYMRRIRQPLKMNVK